MKRIITLLLVLVTILVPAAWAREGQESWDSLKQLRPGQKIEVNDMNLKLVKGTFVSVAENELSIQTNKGPLTIERANVMRVSLRENSKRARNALIGAAIGAGIGIGLGAAADARFGNETGEEHFAMAIFTPIGAGAGAGIGAAIPSYATIYRAPRREMAAVR